MIELRPERGWKEVGHEVGKKAGKTEIGGTFQHILSHHNLSTLVTSSMMESRRSSTKTMGYYLIVGLAVLQPCMVLTREKLQAF